MGAVRQVEFNTGFETSTQPDVGSPSVSADLITKGYADSTYAKAPVITGSTGSPQSIVAGTGIAFSNTTGVYLNVWFIQGSGGAVDISASPQIAAGGQIGQKLLLIGRSATNTVKLEHSDGLILNGEYTMGLGSTLELMWDGTNWVEIARNGA